MPAMRIASLCAAAAVPAAAPASSPQVTRFADTSNAFLVATSHKDTATTRYLGSFASVSECEAACLARGNDSKAGERCESYTYHESGYVSVKNTFPMVKEDALNGQCFATASQNWSPTPRPKAQSGRVLWPCRDDADCSLNGKCGTGTCTCTDPWAGDRCDRLIVDSVTRKSGYLQVEADGKPTSSWKGTVLKGEDGRWHMWASELTNHCGIDAWVGNSRVVHAVSDSGATGTYTRVDEVFPNFATEPHVIRAPTGEYVMYLTMVPQSTFKPCHCTNGSTGPSDCKGASTTGDEPTYMSYASSANGPWSAPQKLFGGYTGPDTNPSPYIFADGSLVGFWRKWPWGRAGHAPQAMGGVIRLFTATNWQDASTYKQQQEMVFPDMGPMGTEDSFLYADEEGRLHAVFHHMFGLPWPENIEHWWLLAGIGHAYSQDMGKTWSYTGLAIRNSTGNKLGHGINIEFDDGWRWYSRQESPMLIFADASKTGGSRITHLVTSVGTGDGLCASVSCSHYGDASYTLVQPLGRSAAGSP